MKKESEVIQPTQTMSQKDIDQNLSKAPSKSWSERWEELQDGDGRMIIETLRNLKPEAQATHNQPNNEHKPQESVNQFRLFTEKFLATLKRLLNKPTTKKVWQPTPRGVGKWKVSGQDFADALNRAALKSPSPEDVAAASAKLDDATRESIFRGLKGKYVDGRIRKKSLNAADRMKTALINKLTQGALDVVYSSTRTKPAHYSSNGERTQSFCVDFPPLTAEDDFAMADNAMSYIVNTPEEGVSEERASLVLKCGEDIMLGSYVIAKQGYPELTNEVARALLFSHDFNFRKPSRWQSKDPLFFEKWTKPYFAFCEEFGRYVATK